MRRILGKSVVEDERMYVDVELVMIKTYKSDSNDNKQMK